MSSAVNEHRCPSPRELYTVKANDRLMGSTLGMADGDTCDEVDIPQDPQHPIYLAEEHQDRRFDRRSNSSGDDNMYSVHSRTTSGTACEESLMISHFEFRSGGNSPGTMVSPVVRRGNTLTAPPNERRVGANPVQHSVAAGRTNGFSATQRDTTSCDCEEPRNGRGERGE